MPIYTTLLLYLNIMIYTGIALHILQFVENNADHVYIRRNYSTPGGTVYTYNIIMCTGPAELMLRARGRIINDLCVLGRTLYYTAYRITPWCYCFNGELRFQHGEMCFRNWRAVSYTASLSSVMKTTSSRMLLTTTSASFPSDLSETCYYNYTAVQCSSKRSTSIYRHPNNYYCVLKSYSHVTRSKYRVTPQDDVKTIAATNPSRDYGHLANSLIIPARCTLLYYCSCAAAFAVNYIVLKGRQIYYYIRAS